MKILVTSKWSMIQFSNLEIRKHKVNKSMNCLNKKIWATPLNLATLRWLTLMHYDSASSLPPNNPSVPTFPPVLVVMCCVLLLLVFMKHYLVCFFYAL